MQVAGVRDWFPVSSRGDGKMLVEPGAGSTPVRLVKAHACLRQHHSLSRSSNRPPLLLSFPLSPLFPVQKVKVSIPELEAAICTCRSVRQTQSVRQWSRCSPAVKKLQSYTSSPCSSWRASLLQEPWVSPHHGGVLTTELRIHCQDVVSNSRDSDLGRPGLRCLP